MISILRGRWWVYGWAVAAVPAIYAASFPLHRMWWLGWIGFAPWFVAVRRVRRGAGAVGICALSTFVGSYFCTPWLARAASTYYGQPLALGVLVFVGVYLVTVAPYVVACVLCYRWLAQRPSSWLPLLGALAWAGAEFLRVRLVIGDPFGLYGYSQAGVTPLIQIADVTGVYGVTALVMAANTAIAELWLACAFPQGLDSRDERRDPLRVSTRADAIRGAAAVAIMLALALAYGALRLEGSLDGGTAAPARIGIAQANLDLGSQWRQEFYGRNLEAYMRLTADLLRGKRTDLLVWPESAMTFFLETEPAYRAAVASVLNGSNTELIAGGPRTSGSDGPPYFNSAFLIAPAGGIVAAYDKQRLLPFAEYFPFGAIEHLRRRFARVREFTPGGPAQLLPARIGSAGVVICNEVMFGEIVGERVRAGASFIVALANDSWLGDAQYAEEAFDMARLRAVEQRRYVIRASTSGPSAIIDPFGRVLSRTADDTRATINGSIQPLQSLTFYARYGDVFGVLCVVLPCTACLRRRRPLLWGAGSSQAG